MSCTCRLIKHSNTLRSCSNWAWTQPTGYESGVTVYNSIAKAKTPLILNNERLATWYSCGPTVYDESHIGHACSYVRFDILRRVLESFFNVDVVMLMGVTDIDDKIINRAREMNINVSNLTRHYEQDFHHDMATLRVIPPTIISRVTDHIPQIVQFCQILLEQGKAYVSDSGTLYFDTRKFDSYGKLGSSGQDVEDSGSESEKKCPQDFALWKASKPGEPYWDTPWGKGRPGWHIECSAMASHVFGPNLDIHSGGIDLKFPHHENEETQCEAYHNKSQWTNYWIHSGHLHIQNEAKMSKSLKNTISIKEFLVENTVNDFRMFCLAKPYRNSIEYSAESLSNAKATVERFKSFLDNCESYIDGHLIGGQINDAEILTLLNSTRINIKEALKDDFNTCQSLNELQNLIQLVNKSINKHQNNVGSPRSSGVVAACSSYVSKILGLLGVDFKSKKAGSLDDGIHVNALPQVMNSLVEFRNKVRVFALTKGVSATGPVVNQSKTSSETSLMPEPATESDKGNMEWTTKNNNKQLKLQRKEREPMLIACDQIRDDLAMVGIQIKDRGKDSGWSFLENRSIEARKSSIAAQDSFDPDYKPNHTKSKPK